MSMRNSIHISASGLTLFHKANKARDEEDFLQVKKNVNNTGFKILSKTYLFYLLKSNHAQNIGQITSLLSRVTISVCCHLDRLLQNSVKAAAAFTKTLTKRRVG